jgi:hypothetical protein
VTDRRTSHAIKNLDGSKVVPIDMRVVERAASVGCSMPEIATICSIGLMTLYDRLKVDAELAAALERGRNEGKSTLRRMQWKLAEEGNPTMLIWLGKQMLGQKDKQEVNGAINSDIRVIVELVGGPPQIEGETG